MAEHSFATGALWPMHSPTQMSTDMSALRQESTSDVRSRKPVTTQFFGVIDRTAWKSL